MRKIKLLFVIILPILIFGAVFFFRNEILDLYSRFYFELSEPSRAEKEPMVSLVEKIEEIILTPPPLKVQKEAPQASLTKEEVITWTNVQRNEQGLPSLKENILLDATAQAKLEDMTSYQYFAHQSPTGLGVGDLAKNFGYQFIMIGENLAMGNFQDDQALVQAWMDSPGHRANILNEKFQEIGVAVGKAVFEGKSTWLAVQHFGLSISICPQPSTALEERIEDNRIEITDLQTALSEMEQELELMRRKPRALYNQKVEEYNDLVFQYNALVNGTKALIEEYNSQIGLFNDCVSR